MVHRCEIVLTSVVILTLVTVAWYISSIATLVPHPTSLVPSRTCSSVNASMEEPSECRADSTDPLSALGAKWNNHGTLCVTVWPVFYVCYIIVSIPLTKTIACIVE
jgi:hypothetical protein